MKLFGLVCLGGALGTGARYAVALGVLRLAPGTLLPIATLAVNVAGSFLLGAVMEAALHGAVTPPVRAVLATGVLGGFTTYSSFNYEVLAAVERGAWLTGVVYAAGTFALCLAAGALGVLAGRAWCGA